MKRTTALVLGLSVVAGGAVAGPSARAAGTPTEEAVFSRGGPAGSTSQVLGRDFYASAPDGSRRELMGAGIGANATVSPDGTRVAYALTTSEDQRQQTVYVADLSGRNRRVLARTGAGETGVNAIDWSPDGQRLLVSVDAPVTSGSPARPGVFVAYADGSAPTPVPHSEGLSQAAFVPTDPARIVAGGLGGVVTARIGEAPVLVPGSVLPVYGAGLDVSPDGAWVAYNRTRQVGAAYVADVIVQRLDGAEPRSLPVDNAMMPAWSLDGRSVYVLRNPRGDASGSDVYRVPVDGGAPVQVTDTPGSWETGPLSVAQRPTAGLAPAAVTATVNGTRPTLAWSNATSPEWARTEVYRALGRIPTAWGQRVYSGTGTSVTDTVELGQAYTYSLVGFDASGAQRGVVRVRLDAVLPPALKVPVVSSSASATRGVPIELAAGQDVVGNFDYEVQYTFAASREMRGEWQPWLSSYGGLSAVFGPKQPIVPRLGTSYVFRARTVDQFGNVSAWVEGGPLAMTFDEASADFSRGWRKVAAKNRWLATAHTTSTAGRSVSFKGTGAVLRVVGDRCAKCGRLAVYLDGRRVATVDTHSATLKTRQVLWSSPRLAFKGHDVRLVALATPGRPQTWIDGFVAGI
ncbi:TolB-like translocation protein [Motilibacter deserti]|uniref:WD40 repeat protein n=1 Tax=Motilibacter deserti TaxID=2714956 RepID=A0ABX0GZI5_9ACTN|nr:hypothetical protein [Motilibacter deserti]NHC14999.1 hypothetical protein [Motilibacter deserti]